MSGNRTLDCDESKGKDKGGAQGGIEHGTTSSLWLVRPAGPWDLLDRLEVTDVEAEGKLRILSIHDSIKGGVLFL